MLFVKNLYKSFGAQPLFVGADFQLNRGEKVGIIGRNGHGKSTLIRLLESEDGLDEGEIVKPDNYRIGALEQHLNFNKASIAEEVAQVLPDEEKHEAWRAEKLLSGLGFAPTDFVRPASEFSGGFQIRIKLAALLLSEPDLLLLDEPTNYLDVLAIRWLERFLQTWKGEVICVSHDHAFLERAMTHTAAVHRLKIKKYNGGPTKCLKAIALEEVIHERTMKNDLKERGRQEKFIREFRSGARSAGLVQSRIKMLEKRESLEALAPIPPIKFKFTETDFNGAKMMEAHNLQFGYPNGPDLLKKIGLELFPGDRVGIIGANGQGKTTLLRALAGEIQTTSGTYKKHINAHLGYLGQSNINRLEPGRTIVEELLTVNQVGEQQARTIAGSLLFSGDLAYKRIEVLSGGEKARVNLGKVLLTPVNVLLLDEPTNHLDYESVQALIKAVNAFDGAVVFVTHDERFLQTVAKQLIVFDGGKVAPFEGPYDQFLSDVGFSSEAEEAKSTPLEKAVSAATDRKKSNKEVQKLLRPLKRQLKEVEKTIGKLETAQTTNKDNFARAYRQGNKLKMETLGIEYQNLQIDLESEMAVWDKLAEQIAPLEASA